MSDGPVGTLVCLALTAVWILFLVRIIVSWLFVFGARPPATGPLRAGHDLLMDVTEPLLRPIRAIVPPAGVMDLSMLVAIVIIFVLQRALC